MHSGIRGTAIALLFVAISGAWRPAGDPLTLAPASRLWFEGKSTVRDWSCKATAIDAVIEADGAAAVAGVLGGTKAVRNVTLTFPVSKLDCENGTMNGHMQKALAATEHPTITFALASYELAPGDTVRGTLQGTLTIKGAARPVTIPAEFSPAGTALRVTGSYALKMTEWQVTPPRLMMGALKVNEMVTVRFDLQLNP